MYKYTYMSILVYTIYIVFNEPPKHNLGVRAGAQFRLPGLRAAVRSSAATRFLRKFANTVAISPLQINSLHL